VNSLSRAGRRSLPRARASGRGRAGSTRGAPAARIDSPARTGAQNARL
jgi:hypothetical protein